MKNVFADVELMSQWPKILIGVKLWVQKMHHLDFNGVNKQAH